MKIKPNGYLTLEVGPPDNRKSVQFIGGPFDFYEDLREDDTVGVCVRAERVPASADINLPIEDFDVPESASAVYAALVFSFRAAFEGKRVYVGCMGGWGRTGLFLALAAKAAGVEDPVAFVRENYTPRAVETHEQKRYVDSYDATMIQRWIANELAPVEVAAPVAEAAKTGLLSRIASWAKRLLSRLFL